MGSELSIRSAAQWVWEHPRTSAAVVLLSVGAGASYVRTDLFALSSTETGFLYDTTSPTLAGRAVNYITGTPSETIYALNSGISETASYVQSAASIITILFYSAMCAIGKL